MYPQDHGFEAPIGGGGFVVVKGDEAGIRGQEIQFRKDKPNHGNFVAGQIGIDDPLGFGMFFPKFWRLL